MSFAPSSHKTAPSLAHNEVETTTRELNVSHRQVNAGGLDMHVAETGSGPPLLLLHGWPQFWWMWRKVLPELSASHRCLAPDLRGLGRTEAPPSGYEKRQLAADVLALLDALQIERVRIVGHDWGGIIAQILASRHPDRVEKALILSAPPLWRGGTDRRRYLGMAHMPLLSAPLVELAIPTLASWVLKLASGRALSEDEVRAYREALNEPARRRASVGYYRAFTLGEFWRGWGCPLPEPAGVPMRYVGGVNDPVCCYHERVELVQGAHHFLPEERPDVVLAAAREFF